MHRGGSTSSRRVRDVLRQVPESAPRFGLLTRASLAISARCKSAREMNLIYMRQKLRKSPQTKLYSYPVTAHAEFYIPRKVRAHLTGRMHIFFFFYIIN